MVGYIVRRLLQAVVTLFILSLLFFTLARLKGANPCGAYALGCTESLHLDQPLVDQYLLWVGGILHGNFGMSRLGQPVGTILLEKLPPTLLLVGVGLIIQQAIALPLGVFSALRPYSLPDTGLTALSYVVLSLPSFLIGFFLILIVGVRLGWFPIGHSADLSLPLLGSTAWWAALKADPPLVLGDMVQHLVMPAFTLVVGGIAIDSRYMRAAMLQVLHEDYLRTAKAKGLTRRRVIFKHAFRNALLPIITNIGLYLPAFLGTVVVVETVFTYGGLGDLFSQAIQGSMFGAPDFPLLEALVLLSSVAVVIANLLADLAYAWLDPRIRFEALD